MIQFLLQKKLAFAIWSLPGEKGWNGIAQNDNETEKLNLNEIHNANGFVVAPFETEEEVTLIRPDVVFDSKNFSIGNDWEDEQSNGLLYPDNNDCFIIDKTNYIKDCTQLIARIKKGEAAKVILSRISEKPFDSEKLLRFFESLLIKYKNAMVFLYSTGNKVWIGASPEVLIDVNRNRFKTMALAGSKPTDDRSDWGQKELDEQHYVTTYIRQQLYNSGLVFEQSKLKTIFAGPVAHLQTVFSGVIEPNKIGNTIKNLHPTPAVCGIPKANAREIIRITEKHERLDYTGYIGPVNQGNINLYVNLRSALLTAEKMFLFIGGGVTSDSIPKKEWEETGLKAKTLLDCYKNC